MSKKSSTFVVDLKRSPLSSLKWFTNMYLTYSRLCLIHISENCCKVSKKNLNTQIIMKKIKFIKEVFSNGKLVKSETLFEWGSLSPRLASVICQNFYDGFLFNFSKPYRCPINPFYDGYEIWSYNFHKNHTGFVYRFVNGRNQTIRFKSIS